MQVDVSYPDYVQLRVERERGFNITDPPPHRSKLIFKWTAANKGGKGITHAVPNHHRDHAGRVYDFVDAGATLVTPLSCGGVLYPGWPRRYLHRVEQRY